jgi:uncharacterized repeat protein (TIGR01451 family)
VLQLLEAEHVVVERVRHRDVRALQGTLTSAASDPATVLVWPSEMASTRGRAVLRPKNAPIHDPYVESQPFHRAFSQAGLYSLRSIRTGTGVGFMQWRHSAAFAVIVVAGLFTACGGGGGSGSSSSSGGAVNSTDTVSLAASGSATPVPSYANTDLEFVLSNTSTVTATNVVLSVTLGNGLSRAGLSCTATGASCPTDPSSLSVGSLPAGGSVRFQMSVIVAGGSSGSLASSASVTSTNDRVSTNNNAEVSITAYSADINIAGSTAAADFVNGSVVPYSMTVSNTGPDAARNVQLEATLSSGQVMQTVDCAASGGATCPAGTGASMTVPLLPSGGSLTFTVTARLSMNVLVSISSTMRATVPGDSNFTNNAVTVSALTRIPTSPSSPTFVEVTSDTGDWIGQGRNYSYTRTNTLFEVYTTGTQLTFKVFGDETWTAEFYMPSNQAQIMPGMYIDRQGAPFHDPATGGFVWRGEGRSCQHSGWFQVDDVTYAQGELASIDIRFEQHCESGTPALRGQIHWVAGDQSLPPGPVNPPPAGLWAPAPGVTPASGNFLYIESDPMDFVGQGATEVFTQANAVITVREELNGVIGINAIGDTNYGGQFQAMVPLTRMAPGYYADVQRAAHGNPTRGRMAMSGNSRGCNVITGWFVIDNIAFSANGIIALDLRFEQHCEGNTPSLRGRIHWRSDDPTTPPGPVVPPPAGLWAPPASAIPATGNAIYMESDPNDFVGQGITELYTPLNSIIDVGGGGMDPVGNRFQLTVTGDHSWTGFFQAMNTLPDLQAGYYGGLLRFPFGNPTRGGLAWYGEGRGCNEASGWFVIDSITYAGNSVDSIQLRFEQHCEFAAPSLRGFIRWSAADTRDPLPPVNPAPAGLWDAPPGTTPASGNYVYLQSEPGSWVGQGETHLYTSHNAVFPMTVTGRQLNVEVHGDLRWHGYFIPMLPLDQLQVGYYGNLTATNTAKGTAYWAGDGRACGGTYGWFMVDGVSYDTAGALTTLDLRFEHRCHPTEPAVRGKIHWRLDDPTQPPGPQNPPPADLWAPPAGATPASGNYFYVTSEPGDFIGMGETHLFTPGNSFIDAGTMLDGFIVGAQDGTEFFTVHFDRMISIPRLQVGYYPNVQRTLLHNPTVAGMDVSGNSRGCTIVSGWFVIDSITHSGEEVTSISARFQQFCGGSGVSLRGAVRWSQ